MKLGDNPSSDFDQWAGWLRRYEITFVPWHDPDDLFTPLALRVQGDNDESILIYFTPDGKFYGLEVS